MKVEIKIDPGCQETTVIILAKEMTDDVSKLAQSLCIKQSHLIVRFRGGNAKPLAVDKIIRIYTANQKVYIVAEDGEYTTRLRLYELEERLPSNMFVRTSNSEIVNLQKIKEFDLNFVGSIAVHFLDSSTTYVSRRYVAKIKKILGL